jgi:hypothetical protein
MKKITSFLKTYWWLWIILLILSISIIIFSPLKVGLVVGQILFGFVILILWMQIEEYTLKSGQIKAWGVFRFIGGIGFCIWLFLLITIIVVTIKRKVVPGFLPNVNANEDVHDMFFSVRSLIFLLTSLFLFILGEFYLYLDNIQQKLKDNDKITCPRCYGKGFVDLNDIKRLGKEGHCEQGICWYCETTGKIDKSKLISIDPRDFEKS